MNTFIWLSILQAVTVAAAPRDRLTWDDHHEARQLAPFGNAHEARDTSGGDLREHYSPNYPGVVGITVTQTTAVTSSVVPGVSLRKTFTVTGSDSGTAQILPPPSTQTPATLGTVMTLLNLRGHATQGPIISTSIASPTTTLSPLRPSATSSSKPSTQSSATSSSKNPAVVSSTSVSVTPSATPSVISSSSKLSGASSAKTSSTSSSTNLSRASSTKTSSTSLMRSSTASSSASSIKSPISSSTSIANSLVQPSGASTSQLPIASSDIFQPVATNAPPTVLGSRVDHPVPRLDIMPQSAPLSTNKFYANFFLGSQTAATWTHPYSVAWVKGGGQSKSWGLSVSHIDSNQRALGPNASANPVEYFINPIGIQSIILSASELNTSSTISIDSLTSFSVNINLLPSVGANASITFPLVQGMGFVTAMYHGGTPVLQSIVLFRSLTKVATSPKPGVSKFIIVLEDGKTWFLYAYSPSGAGLEFTVVNNGYIQATSNFDGIIQVAKNPVSGTSAEAIYDAGCGAFATGVKLSGTADEGTGTYTLSFTKAGLTNTTLTMFALPHHMQSLSPGTASAATSIQLNTTTKGAATAIVADSWTLVESLPTTMGFGPWSPTMGNNFAQFSAVTTKAIHAVATSEISQDISGQTNLNSMYYSGKALAKFAYIVYTLNDLLADPALARAGLVNLKKAFAVFANNTQQYPLVYESAWGGVVSTASYTTGNSGADFGNTYYNDHHFHYGYFILTAAIIGYLDPTWLPANAPYINTLVRDIANPSALDPYFPVSRMFDWYHGHSWAHGLYETFDGKDQESSSEDSMSAYAIKLWGRVIGDANLEARGNLQLAITARSLQSYFLYDSANTVQPAYFVGNKVSGILFENKIDHTTYFGTNIEYIQGIHMLPILPHSSLTRTKKFVQEEWNTYFSNGRANKVAGGWRGILYSNLALIDPTTAWGFFNNASFDASLLDGGASRTWYMAFSAAMGGSTS